MATDTEDVAYGLKNVSDPARVHLEEIRQDARESSLTVSVPVEMRKTKRVSGKYGCGLNQKKFSCNILLSGAVPVR